MAKLLICIALVFVAVASARFAPGPGGPPAGPGGPPAGPGGPPAGPGGPRPGPGGPRPGPGGPRPGPGGPRPGPGGPHPHGSGNNSQWASKLCANESVAQLFLIQIQELITELQSNGSYTQVLANRQNEITYIQNENSTNLLSSNCPEFFSGLSNARNLDQQAQEQQRQYQKTAAQLLIQIVRSLFGGGADASSEES